jgi:hypothetical protein
LRSRSPGIAVWFCGCDSCNALQQARCGALQHKEEVSCRFGMVGVIVAGSSGLYSRRVDLGLAAVAVVSCSTAPFLFVSGATSVWNHTAAPAAKRQ